VPGLAKTLRAIPAVRSGAGGGGGGGGGIFRVLGGTRGVEGHAPLRD